MTVATGFPEQLFHPSTVLARCCFTELLKWALVNARLAGLRTSVTGTLLGYQVITFTCKKQTLHAKAFLAEKVGWLH